MNLLYAALIGLICGAAVGYMYRDNAFEHAQVEVLKSDAIELPKVEVKDDERKKHDAKIIADALAKLPKTDCFVSRITADNVIRLRSGSP